jgi:hypothetical protein
MSDQSDSQIGIQFPLVRLTQRDNVGLIEYGNQGPRYRVNSCGLVRKAHLRRLAKKTAGEKEQG